MIFRGRFYRTDIKDGLHVYSDGKIRIQGSASSAEIKAENGLVVNNNIIACKIIVGEKHVFGLSLSRDLLM